MAHAGSVNLFHGPGGSLDNRLTALALSVLAAEPGLSNRELARRAAVANEAQMSRTLKRAARLGLISNARDTRGTAPANAWQLTAAGVPGRVLDLALACGCDPGSRTRSRQLFGARPRGCWLWARSGAPAADSVAVGCYVACRSVQEPTGSARAAERRRDEDPVSTATAARTQHPAFRHTAAPAVRSRRSLKNE